MIKPSAEGRLASVVLGNSMNHRMVLLIVAWFVLLFNIERLDINDTSILNISNPTYGLAVIVGIAGLIFPRFGHYKLWRLAIVLIGTYIALTLITEHTSLDRPYYIYPIEIGALLVTLLLMRRFSFILMDYELLLEKLIQDETTSRFMPFEKAMPQMEQEIKRASHYDRPLTLIYCMVYRSEKDNKPTTGELQGLRGQALERRYQIIKLANVVTLLSYETDIMCLYGDGVVICLPETDRNAAIDFVSQLNQLVQMSMGSVLIAGISDISESESSAHVLLQNARGKVQIHLTKGKREDTTSRRGDLFLDLDKRLEIEKQSDWVNRLPFQSSSSLAVYRPIKRLMDIFASVVAAILLLPLFLVVVLLIIWDSGFPIFYMQPRTGYNGHRFMMYKFRSMKVGAAADPSTEIRLPDGTVRYEWAEKKGTDPRITRIGRILRKSSIDELPQLLNVIKGDMSLVGPRPTTWALDKFTMLQTERLTVRPGITGLWQVCARESTNFDERVLWDIKYVAKMSLWLDIQILVRTVLQVVNSKGA